MSDDPPASGPEGADEDREEPEEPRDSPDTEPADHERATGETGADGSDEEPEAATNDEGAPDSDAEDGRPASEYVEPPGESAPPDEADSADDEDSESDTGDEDEADASGDQVEDATDAETEADGDEEGEDDDEAGVDDEEDEDEAGDGDEAGVDAADSDEEEDEDDRAGDDDDEAAEETPGEGEEADAEEDADEDDEEGKGDEEDADADGDDEESGGTKVEMHDDATPIQRKTGPASDKEQPLAEHIEEMVKRLAVVVVVAGAVSLLAFPFGEDFILFLWYSVLPADISQPHVYHPLELVITQLKAASLLGLVIALPVFVYETYAFMRPGLYPHERRYYLAAVPTSLVLAFVGLLFGYFIVLPAVMNYFLYYSDTVVDIAFALGQTFSLMLILLGYLAIVFQIPLFVMLAIMMGLTTRVWLEDRRLIFWGAFLGISFLFSPDPTGMAPIVIAATMVALFEGTLLMLRWTGRG